MGEITVAGAAVAEHRFELEQAAPHTPLDGRVPTRRGAGPPSRRTSVTSASTSNASPTAAGRGAAGTRRDGPRVSPSGRWRRRSRSRHGRDDRQLAEEVARPDADVRDVAERGGHTDRDMTLAQEMERLTRVSLRGRRPRCGRSAGAGRCSRSTRRSSSESALEDRPVHAHALPNEAWRHWARCTRSAAHDFALGEVTGSFRRWCPCRWSVLWTCIGSVKDEHWLLFRRRCTPAGRVAAAQVACSAGPESAPSPVRLLIRLRVGVAFASPVPASPGAYVVGSRGRLGVGSRPSVVVKRCSPIPPPADSAVCGSSTTEGQLLLDDAGRGSHS